MIYDILNIVRRWSLDTVRRWSSDTFWRCSLDIVWHWSSDAFRRWNSDTFWRCSSEAVRHWCSAAKDTLKVVRRWSSDARGPCLPGRTSNPRCGIKINKASIKAGNLKGLLGYPTCKLVECISAILKIEDKEDLLNQFSRPTAEDEE